MMDQRPDPELLLGQIKKEQEQSAHKRGRLKIFFGYAAGVGKTYAMLEAAHQVKKKGVDVVAGYIEPHVRPETLALLDGLEVLPPLKAHHKGIVLNEFDLDGALKRHPQLILVDELAHSNADECRHIKRYQDINELLTAGIDVYTTVNVQHLESLNDIVASITGVTVRERIPDSVFDNADQVELVDIEPEDLISRLNNGKIYREQQAQKALDNFFTVENLISLREIALRRTADRVNRVSEKKKKKSTSYTEEHILICLSAAPSNAKVIRTAARMASAFKGMFTALFVETPDFVNMNDADRMMLRNNLKLAEQLGAKIATVYGEDIPAQIAEFARLSGVSKIVLGRTNAKKNLLFPKPSFADRLTQMAPNLDIYIIPDKHTHPYRKMNFLQKHQYTFSVKDTVKALGVLIIVTLICLGFFELGFSEANIITIYILGVLLTSIITSNIVYSLVSALFSVLVFNFLFTEPRFTFSANGAEYPVTFVVMFIAAFITGTLTMKLKDQARQVARRAYRTSILLETNQKLQQANTKSEIICETANQLIKLLDRNIIFYGRENNSLRPPAVFCRSEYEEDILQYTTHEEQAVAKWVFKNNKHAGATTNTLPGAKSLYMAVRGKEQVYGVVAVVLNHDELDSFENSLLISMLGECGLALDQEYLNETKKQAAMKAQQEQLRANLLRSISHDLRTPLTSISGNAGMLMSSADSLDKDKRMQLYTDIYDDSMWLFNLVENLLSVTRIEDGSMNIRSEVELLEEVITESLRHINRESVKHHIRVEMEDDLIMARMDSRLMIQVFINIIDNAIKYTPEGSHITVSVKKKGKWVEVSIADDGNGIPDNEKVNLFEMFYTTHKGVADSRRGLGLGLALCKSIINAHGGDICVKDNHPHGAIFQFTLPAEEVTIHE